METPTLNVPLPGLIDGDTDEVEQVLIEAIYGSMDQIAEWVDAFTRQLANSERSRILEDNPSMTASALFDAYEATDRHATLTRLNGAARALVSATYELRGI